VKPRNEPIPRTMLSGSQRSMVNRFLIDCLYAMIVYILGMCEWSCVCGDVTHYSESYWRYVFNNNIIFFCLLIE
jgi:hypothetical protein